MTKEIHHVAVSIFYQADKYLMQLRDNIPTILYPGFWGLFGGHIESGETPEIAVKREIIEEIGYETSNFTKFGNYPDEKAVRHVFYAPLTVDLDKLVLGEGWDMGLLSAEDIRKGECYSAIAQEVRPLGRIHQKIMLDFIEKVQV
ncbi:MAG: NUDIX hydrolase [Cyanobacteria bacterium P01_A01_bin.84]